MLYGRYPNRKEPTVKRLSDGEYDLIAEQRVDGMAEHEARTLEEYSSIAEYCAKRGIAGNDGDQLPYFASSFAIEMINDDPEAFRQHVREHAYAIAMNKLNLPEE